MKLVGQIVLAFVLMVLAPEASACEPAEHQSGAGYTMMSDDGSLQKHDESQLLTLSADGAFESATVGAYNTASGAPVIDLSDGKILQVIGTGHACFYAEYLFFMDCNRDDSIVLSGKENLEDDFTIGLPPRLVQYIQPPFGPVDITSSSTVGTLAEIAEGAKISFVRHASDFFEEDRDLKRVGYRRACQIMYPNSPGAKG